MNHNTHTFSWNAGKEKPTLSESVKPWLLRLCFLSSKGLVSGACHLCAGEFLQSRSQEILRGDSHLVLLQTTHLGLHLVGQILEKFHFLPFKSWNLTWQAVGPENEAVRGLVAFVLPWARPSVSMSFLGFWLQSDWSWETCNQLKNCENGPYTLVLWTLQLELNIYFTDITWC